MKLVLKIIGFIATGLAFAGVFLPLLPTTPFLILAAYCFSKSSERYHQWLLNHPWFGAAITRWEKEGSIENKHKVLAMLTMWPMMLFSAFYLVPVTAVKFLLILIACCVSAYILTRPSPSVSVTTNNHKYTQEI